MGKRGCGPLICSSRRGKLKLENPAVCWGNKPCFSVYWRGDDFTGEESSRILEVDLAGKRCSEIKNLAGESSYEKGC